MDLRCEVHDNLITEVRLNIVFNFLLIEVLVLGFSLNVIREKCMFSNFVEEALQLGWKFYYFISFLKMEEQHNCCKGDFTI